MMNRAQIIEANRKIENQTLNELALTNESIDDDIELNQEFAFLFDLEGDITKSKVVKYDDEHLILKWSDFIKEVDNWFSSIINQAIVKAPVLVDGNLQERITSLPYLNQLSDMNQLNYLHNKAKDLRMNNRSDGTDFGTFMRIDEIIQLRNKVLSSHNFCLSTFKRFLTKIYIYNKDACYTNLYRNINNLISTGIFLRKYRDDLTQNQLSLAESRNPELNKIIDFRNHEDRVDYLNTEMSIFVEPELNLAEKYLHVLIKAKHDTEQQLVNERDRKAQNGGRYLKSKKINNLYNKGRYSRKNKIYYGGSLP